MGGSLLFQVAVCEDIHDKLGIILYTCVHEQKQRGKGREIFEQHYTRVPLPGFLPNRSNPLSLPFLTFTTLLLRGRLPLSPSEPL